MKARPYPWRRGRRHPLIRWRSAALAAALSAVAAGASGCSAVEAAVPGCGSVQRLAIVAQSVPGAAYVPCVSSLAPGWKAVAFRATRGSTRFSLVSDRAGGHPVDVALLPGCDVRGATLTGSRAPGANTYTRLTSITPLYSGTVIDVFAGGCVTYRFAFERGPHIPLMQEFESAVGLVPRQELSLQLDRRLGVRLGP